MYHGFDVHFHPGPRGCDAPPHIFKKVHLQPQMGQKKWVFVGVVGGEVHKVHFLSPKGPLFVDPAPPQNRSWLRVCFHFRYIDGWVIATD